MPQGSLDLGGATGLWHHVPIEHPPGRELADRHYSRETPGAVGYVPPGERFLLEHCGVNLGGAPALAIWAVCRNRFRGQWRFRNSIFRNETTTLSSELIREAVVTSAEVWTRRYLRLPEEPLTTEIDIEATRARRGKKSMPGECYRRAGWEFVEIQPRSHGRPSKAIWRCPPWAFTRWW